MKIYSSLFKIKYKGEASYESEEKWDVKEKKGRVIRDVGGDIWDSGIRKTKGKDGILRRSKP